jgi:hypothetical protein
LGYCGAGGVDFLPAERRELMTSWRNLLIGWAIASICGFAASYGIANVNYWWARPLIFLLVPAGAWLVFGSILTLVTVIDGEPETSTSTLRTTEERTRKQATGC